MLNELRKSVLVLSVFALLIIGLTGRVYSAEEGLVAYWPMDEGKGSVIRDKSGNGNDGKLFGATWVEDKGDKALSFDGINDYVDCGNNTSVNIADALTIEFWIKPDIQPKVNTRIVSKGDTGMGKPEGYQYMVYLRSRKINFHLSNGNKIKDIAASVTIGAMQHIVLTWDGNTMKIFVNGEKKATGKLVGPLNSNDNDRGLYIGSSKGGSYFKGVLNEVRIYNRALSEEKILEKRSKMLREEIVLLIEEKIQSLANLIPALSELREVEKINSSILQMDKILTVLKEGNKKLLTYIIEPITNMKIFPDALFIPGEDISNEVSIIACPGEYEPASFVIVSLDNIKDLRLIPTDLKSKDGKVISSSNLDLKVVKCWYQSGGGETAIPVNRGRKVFTPELLLKDDSLVKVDTEKKENYLKLNYPEGEMYLCISRKEDLLGFPYQKGRIYQPTVDVVPIKDSQILLPLDIPAGTNKQFWITAHVPEDANPGIYTGEIKLSTSKEVLGCITLMLRVLPFRLSKPYYTSSIYYRGKLDPAGKGTIGCDLKNEKQFRAELENLFAHGVTNPFVYNQPFGEEGKELGKVLTIRNEIGMRGPLYYCYGISLGNDHGLKDRIKKILEFVKSYGISEVYFYGIDEATGEKLKAQRPAWEAVRQAGGKIFVADLDGNNFESMGDIQDICIHYPALSKKEAEKWHSVGHKIWSYGKPFGGVEEPETYRRNYGLLLWQNDYDGAANYVYQGGAAYGFIWNDFHDRRNTRHFNFTYPTVDGIIDTIQWEGYREAVDDVRYLTTLLKVIEKAKKSKNRKIKKSVILAEKYLKELKSADLNTRDLNVIRLEIIDYILKLTESQ